MSEMFPSLPDEIEMGDLFRAFPKTVRPLLDYHDRLLRDTSPLTVAERTRKATGKRQACPVSYALEIFGDRWTLLILRDVMLETRYRFRDLLAANKGLATNVLSDRLQRLVRRGLLSRVRDDADARQFVYKPTETALSIVPMLLEMIIWSAEQGNVSVPPSLVKRFRTDLENLIVELQQEIRERAGLRPH